MRSRPTTSASQDARFAELRLVIIDDHALFADGLALLLGRLGDAVQVTRFQSCEEALEAVAPDAAVDLVLFDLTLPGAHHLEALELLRARLPGIPIVAVSADERPRMIADVVRAGARGYIPKSTGAEIMLNALRLVLAGGVYVPEAALGESPAARAETELTPRERQVLELLVANHGNKAIAAQLGMAESTVRVHVTSILRRLGLASRAEAATSSAVNELLRRAQRRDP